MQPLVDAVARRLVHLLETADDRSPPVSDGASPDRIAAAFEAAGVPLPLRPDEPAHPVEALDAAVGAVLAHSVRTLHPRFFNQNFAGPDVVAVLGDWLGAALNTTAATYEAAPVGTLIERAVCTRLAALAGWDAHDGVFVAGGSLSNLHAMHLARHRVAPDAVERGNPPGGLAAFTSAEAHYSVAKAMALMGLGRRALRVVPCDARGQMRPDALEAAIHDARRAGQRPFFVNATAGTTVLGAFDPIDALGDICRYHDLWLHVDGCFGASALFSPRERHRMAGVERADSLAWNLHKMMGATQQCSALLVRHPGLLRAAFASGADYLFQPDKPHAALDSGDLTFQCARRVDALKAWLTWKARGDAGFAARIEHAVDLAARTAARLEADPRFALAAPPSWVNVCFWWVPADLRPLDRAAPGVDVRLHGLAPRIKARLLREGSAMVGYQPVQGGPNAWRLLFINPAATDDDVTATLDAIDAAGRGLPHPV